jgi:hypothetical protein
MLVESAWLFLREASVYRGISHRGTSYHAWQRHRVSLTVNKESHTDGYQRPMAHYIHRALDARIPDLWRMGGPSPSLDTSGDQYVQVRQCQVACSKHCHGNRGAQTAKIDARSQFWGRTSATSLGMSDGMSGSFTTME